MFDTLAVAQQLAAGVVVDRDQAEVIAKVFHTTAASTGNHVTSEPVPGPASPGCAPRIANLDTRLRGMIGTVIDGHLDRRHPAPAWMTTSKSLRSDDQQLAPITDLTVGR